MVRRRGSHKATARSSMKIKPSIPEREIEVARLCEYFSSLPNGAKVSWEEIEEHAGVRMNMSGREQARRALRRLRWPYLPVRGEGVVLSSADSALTIMRGKFVKIDHAVRKADTTRAHLTERHLPDMSGRDQRSMLLLASFFGAVRTIANDARRRVLALGKSSQEPEPAE
jgi:hypothetical protein